VRVRRIRELRANSLTYPNTPKLPNPRWQPITNCALTCQKYTALQVSRDLTTVLTSLTICNKYYEKESLN